MELNTSDEYHSLRNEIIARIEIMNNQAFSSLSTVITTWAAGFSLMGIYVVNMNKFSAISAFIISLGSIFSFFISVCLLLPLAVKSGENIKQINGISAYIRVFFEFRNPDSQFHAWEHANSLISSATSKKGSRALVRFHNSEYLFLSLTSVIFLGGSGVLMLLILKRNYNSSVFESVLFACILSAFLLISIYLTRQINIISSVKYNMMDINKDMTMNYIKYAEKIGYFTHEESENAKIKMNPDQTLEQFENNV